MTPHINRCNFQWGWQEIYVEPACTLPSPGLPGTTGGAGAVGGGAGVRPAK